MAKAKLSDREKAAQKLGIAVDYSKSAKQQGKSLQPVKVSLPKALSSKTPQAKLYQAQKSQPIAQKSTFMKSDPVRLTGIPKSTPVVSKSSLTVEEMTNPNSSFNRRQKEISFKNNISNANENARKAKEDAENAKKESGIFSTIKRVDKTLRDNTYRKLALYQAIKQKSLNPLKEAAKNTVSNIAPKIDIKNPYTGKYASGSNTPSKDQGSVFDMGFTGGGLVGATKSVASKASKGIFDTIKNKAKGLFSSVGKQSEKNSVARSGITDLAEQQRIAAANRAKVADSIRTPRALAAENADEALKTLSKTDGTSSNVRNIRFNEPKIGTPEFSPRTPSASNAGRIARDEAPKSIPRGRTELPKRNTNKANDLFEEPDDLGRSKVFTNVREGDGSLKRVEIGEFDETGRFKEKTAEDGRPISEVIDEGNRNLASGKRGVTRIGAPGDARAALKPFEKPQKVGMLQTKKLRDKRGKYAGSESLGANKNVKAGDIRRELSEAKDATDTDLMMQIERVLPSIREYRGLKDLARHGDRLDDADALEATLKKFASNKAITDEERRGAMEALARFGAGTKTYYGKGMLHKPVYDPKAEGVAKGRIATQNTDALTQEARKYKSAEEFVRANQNTPEIISAKAKLTEIQSRPDYQEFTRGGKITGKTWNDNNAASKEYRNAVDANTERLTAIWDEAKGGGKAKSLGTGGVQKAPTPGVQAASSIPQKTLAIRSEKTSVSPPTPQNPRVSPSWVSKIGTSLREVVQDNWVRVKNIQKEVGKEINSKDLSPYQAETLMHGRTQARLDAVKEAVTSIDKEIAAVKDASFRKKVDQYLIAKHAPERNAVHGERAAGMSNEEASAILNEIGDNKEVKAVAEKIKDLNYKTLEILKDSQVISDETYRTLRSTYKEHVPLNRIMDDTDLEQYLIGKGLDVKSSGLKRAKGSEREVADVLTNVSANLEQAVVRAEKNRVNLATLKFARENKALGVFEEVKPKAIGKTFDGKPLLERVDDPNVLTVMENGKPVYLKIKDDKLAEAFKAVGDQKLPALFNFIGGFTRLYSGLATRFNPEFAFSNKLRDLQEMAAYMASQKGIGFSGAVKTTGRDVVSMADVTAGILGKDTAGARLYRQMAEDGGTTGGMALSTRKQLEIDIENIRQMNRAGIFNVKKAGQKFLSTIDSWNEVFENSTRLSVYKTALDKGMTRDQAAYLAKNSTINFNKKGTGGGIINSLYMFSNASIQGTTKLLSSLKNPKVATAVTAAVGSSVWATNQWNDSVDPEWRTKVDKWDRESNLIVALPTSEGAKYMTIPVSWGIKPMKVMADYAYDALNGKADQKTGFDVAGKVIGSMWNAYNPVGGSSLGSSIVPTIGDVPYDIATNTKWSGSMIHPTSKAGVPESENFFKNKEGVPSDKSGMFGMLTRGTKSLANATGGEIQVNPASLKYAIDSYLSGAGRSISGTAETISAIGSDKELQTKDTPFLRRFLKEKTPEELEKSQKFGKKDALHEELKRLPREKQPEKIQEYLNSIQDEDQRKGAAYGLMQEGFNTKGTSTSSAIIQMKPTYEKVKQLEREGKEDEAQSIVDNLSDEDYEKYKKVRASVRTKNTEAFRELLRTDPKKAVEFNRAQDEEEGNRLIELLTDEEYDLYERGKL